MKKIVSVISKEYLLCFLQSLIKKSVSLLPRPYGVYAHCHKFKFIMTNSSFVQSLNEWMLLSGGFLNFYDEKKSSPHCNQLRKQQTLCNKLLRMMKATVRNFCNNGKTKGLLRNKRLENKQLSSPVKNMKCDYDVRNHVF